MKAALEAKNSKSLMYTTTHPKASDTRRINLAVYTLKTCTAPHTNVNEGFKKKNQKNQNKMYNIVRISQCIATPRIYMKNSLTIRLNSATSTTLQAGKTTITIRYMTSLLIRTLCVTYIWHICAFYTQIYIFTNAYTTRTCTTNI